MAIAFTCSCGKTLKAKDELAGKTVRCPACGKPAKVPTGGSKADPPSRIAKPASKPPVVTASTKTAKKPAPAKPPSDDIDLLPDESVRPASNSVGGEEADAFTDAQVQSLTAKSKACPFCGSQIFEGAPVCIDCGTDLKTGKKIVKKKERRPLGPLIKLVVILLVVGGGGLYGLKKLNQPKQSTGTNGPEQTADKTTPARVALRDGNLADFKTFAKALATLSQEDVEKVVRDEISAPGNTPAARKKALIAVACLAWYGFATDDTVNQMMIGLRTATDDDVRKACLEGIYAAATLPPAKRYIPLPAMFAGLDGDISSLKKPETPATTAANRIAEKADDAPTPALQMEAIKFAVLLGQRVMLQRFAMMYDSAAAEQKPDVLKSMQEMTGQTFKDGAEFTEWWTTGGAIRQSQKEWVAKRLEPANDIGDLRAAVRILRFLVDEKVDDKASSPIDKASDDDVKASAAQWKSWCDGNPDKLK